MDLELAYETIKAKGLKYARYWNYYDGVFPTVYTNRRLAEVFGPGLEQFSANWCAMVVEALDTRLDLQALSVPNNEPVNRALREFWLAAQLDQLADSLHESALVTGESYAIAWPDEEGRMVAHHNAPERTHLFYESADPRRKRFGAKLWTDETQHLRLSLYYDDRIEFYISTLKADQVDSAKSFAPLIPEPAIENPYGEVPFFHFRFRDRIKSPLADVIPLENAINKLLEDMMAAAEYGAFKQRWVISNADIQQLKNAPNKIWEIPAGDTMSQATQVGEFGATELDNYLTAIERLVITVGAITALPKHYFLVQPGDPSGEALMAMESPLVKRVQDYIRRLSATWRELARFVCAAQGISLASAEVTVRYTDPRTVQPFTQAQVREKEIAAGIPLPLLLAREGWSQEELVTLATEMEAQRQRELRVAEDLAKVQAAAMPRPAVGA